MRSTSPPRARRTNVRADHARLRAEGLRPVQIWLPNVRTREFAAQARRQSRLVAASTHEKDDQDFVDAVTADLAD
jgi:hypothetical protein